MSFRHVDNTSLFDCSKVPIHARVIAPEAKTENELNRKSSVSFKFFNHRNYYEQYFKEF